MTLLDRFTNYTRLTDQYYVMTFAYQVGVTLGFYIIGLILQGIEGLTGAAWVVYLLGLGWNIFVTMVWFYGSDKETDSKDIKEAHTIFAINAAIYSGIYFFLVLENFAVGPTTWFYILTAGRQRANVAINQQKAALLKQQKEWEKFGRDPLGVTKDMDFSNMSYY